ncbi:resolvase [Afipia sp. Root123D2]|uniref:recombinase family protein n=1 Tax=Afipia sp. Root123D2 TaxID=1736436 RepID=UPI0006F5436E|nr:recombinase family protein [Afipia sp. Root123D2]KQW21045.1 resolvase [Afipia sp. Root123D2]
MNRLEYIAYYRVSTNRQGKSGLGLAAQREAVKRFLGSEGIIFAEYTEIESGRRCDRLQLQRALATARLRHMPLVVAKVDRLTRSVSFLSTLLDAGVTVRFADLPTLDGPTGRFMLQQMAAVAELEAGMISARTKAALAAAKARGKKLGGDRGGRATREAQAQGRATQSSRALIRAKDLVPLLNELAANGIVSARQVALALNERRIPTPRHKTWSSSQVISLIKLAKSL